MKKILFILIMALPAIFTACSDDNDAAPNSSKVVYEGYKDFTETMIVPNSAYDIRHYTVIEGIKWKNNYEAVGYHNGDTIKSQYDSTLDHSKQLFVTAMDSETGFLKVMMCYGTKYEFEYGKLETRENVYIKVTVR